MTEQYLFTGLDSEIAKIDGIFWKPWIGKKYFDSEERLLIIGESHYVHGETEEEYLKKYEYCKKSADFTRECIYESAVSQDWHNNTYENIHRTLLKTTNFDRESLWEKISFYNFIPRTMDYRKYERPEYMDYYNSWKSFVELLTHLKPTTCLFIGVEASNSFNAAMAELGVQIENVRWGDKIGNTYSRDASMNKNGITIPLIFIQHASKFYSWSNWSNFVKSKAPSTINFLRKEVLGNGFIEEEKEDIQEVNDLRALKIPTWLTHKPIISSFYPAVSNDQNDDAIYLSAGRAQYNEEAMSIKLFRSNGDRWSRQSEEIPIERVADFTLMLLASIKSYKNIEFRKTILNEQVIVNEDLGFIKDQVELNKERIKKSLIEIKRLMDEIDIENL